MTTPEIIDELEWARLAKPSPHAWGPPDCTSQKDFFASFDLEDCERWIEFGIGEFLNAGKALVQIHDRHLYREAGYTNFETYCTERWGFRRAHAYRLMDAAKIAIALSPNGDIPWNEAQARALAPLKDDPEALQEAWDEAQDRAAGDGRRATAGDVEKVVAERTRYTPRPMTPARIEKVAANIVLYMGTFADVLREGLSDRDHTVTSEDLARFDQGMKALREFRKHLVVGEPT
jgi:hypothetical protein